MTGNIPLMLWPMLTAAARSRFGSLQDFPLLQRAVPGEIAQQELPSFIPHSRAESLQGHMTDQTPYTLPAVKGG